MWIWLIAVILLIGIWLGGFFFLSWPLWLAILLTVVVVLMIVGWYVWKRVRAVMKAKALEREILKQAEQQAMNARPDRRAEILELQMQVQRGLAALKASKLGASRGGSALYSLPWYMIIGPPGAGKTTALRHSGLVFPFLDPRTGGGVKGIGGTRNCDWWFTNEAIILDTAGRYTTEVDDHEEWLSFLGMLKKYRSRKPLNGVLVAVSVTDLMDATEEQIDTMAKTIRARVDEVMTRLAMVVPVYVVFTKVDLVAGFVEFWNDLRKSERSQIWGVTWPLDGAEHRDPTRSFEAEFDTLVEAVHARALRRIGNERQWESRQKIFQFPIEYAALKQNLAEFVGALFQKNTFQETPIFRGVYFTSGTQEGRPIDRVIGGMMRAFNIAPQQGAAHQAQQESKSYFVTDMFRRVVFPDQFVAGRTKGELRRQLLNRLAFAAVALFLATLIVLPALWTWWNNQQLIAETQQMAAEANKVDWSTGGNVAAKAKKLSDVRAQVQNLDLWREKDRPLKYRWFMYQGDKLYEPLKDVYLANLKSGFADPTKRRIEEELRGVTSSAKLNTETYNKYFTTLKTYLLVCDMESRRLKIPVKLDGGIQPDLDFEGASLTDWWAKTAGSTKDDDKDALKPHVEYYLDLLKRDELQPWQCDRPLVERVRRVLKDVSQADRNYNRLIGPANADPAGRITRDSIFANMEVYTYVTSKSTPPVYVDGAFTKYGWENYIRARLAPDRAEQLASERWVLGESEERSREVMRKELEDLKNRYFADYTEKWRLFIRDLDVRTPKSNDEALKELEALSNRPWPYEKLIKTLGENVMLEEEPEDEVMKRGKGLLDRVKAEADRKLKQNATAQVILGDAGVADQPPPKPRWQSPPERSFEPMVKFGMPTSPGKDGKEPPSSGPGLKAWQEQVVNKLVAVLSDLQSAKRTGPDAKQVELAFQDAFRATKDMLNASQDGFTRPLLAPLLMNPIELGYAGVLKDLGKAAGGKWEAEVWRKWRLIEDRYPFTDSPKDVPMQDYNAFFNPKEGLLWAFYEHELKGSLEKDGMGATIKFVPTTRFGQSVAYKPEFLRCYNRGWEITQSTFPGKTEGALVEFDVNLHSVSENVAEVTFEIDGVGKTYKNEPEEWLHIQWPAKEPKSKGARIRIRGSGGLDEQILRPGDFGFFRLVDAANRVEAGTEGGRRGAPPTTVVTWVTRSQPGLVKIDIRPTKADNVFDFHVARKQRIFRDYKCPRLVAEGK